MGINIILSVVAQTSFLKTFIALYYATMSSLIPPPPAHTPHVPCDDPPPRVVDVGCCRYRRRLLPSSAVVVGHNCRRRRPLPSSAVIVGRCRCRRRLLPSAVVVGCYRCLPLTLLYAAAVVYHCLCRRLLPSRTTASGGVMAEVHGSELGVSGC